MRSKISLKRSLVVVGIVGTAFFAIVVLFAVPNLFGQDSGRENPQNLAEIKPVESNQTDVFIEQARAGLPVRLKIPEINVDSAVEHVGFTPAGAMDVPKGPDEVAWFDLGPRPGEKGSAAIAGHYGWKNGIPAAFDNLDKLKKGDKIYVEDDGGAIITFVVRESRTYAQNEDAPEVFGSNDGKAHLNLITCEGTWNKAQKSYSNRLVVFTDKEAD